MAWKLVHPSRVDIHSLKGSLTFGNTVESTVYGDGVDLYTHADGDQIPEWATEVWYGGHYNTTEDPLLRDRWVLAGYSVVEV